MKMDIVAGSNNDEFYTPEYAIRPLLKYLETGKTVWCPFDNERSNFVKLLRESGLIVITSHIESGQDFFSVCEEYKNRCDYIISNPPYSRKGEVIAKLFSLRKPFAMLVGVVGLFESKERFTMFKNNTFEIMYFDKRIAYFKSFDEQKPSLNPPFSSVFVCSGILPQAIVFEELDKKQKVLNVINN